MKKIIAALTLFLSLVLNGHADTSGSFTYETANSQVTITGYSGPDGAVTIPSEINNLPVTRIGNRVFFGRINLTSVTIPDSVTALGNSVFEGCHGLTSVTIPASVSSIGNDAFVGCRAMKRFVVATNNSNYSASSGILFNKNLTTLIAYPATKSESTYTIPNSVNSIGPWAFHHCLALTQMRIPSGVTNIGFGPFVDCGNLTAITVDSGNPNFFGSDGVLLDKAQTKLIQYPAGRPGTFYLIPASVKSIGAGAFYGCERLTSMTIPNGVTSIEMYTFGDCTGLKSVTIPNGVKSIGQAAFAGCTGLIGITLPDSVTDVDIDAFADCSSLSSVIISKSLASIRDYSFGGCSSLISIAIPKNVTKIEPFAFQRCSSLTSIYFQGNAPIVDHEAFADTYPTVYYYAGTAGWGDSFAGRPTFEMVSSQTPDGLRYDATATEVIITGYTGSGTVINIPDEIDNLPVTQIGNNSFEVRSSLTKVTIPNSVVRIGDFAFNNCTGLTSVTIGNSVAHIGNSAFNYCYDLTNVTLPSSLISIGEEAFSDSGITSLKIPDRVTTIGNSAFGSCGKLIDVTIPSSVTSIGDEVFAACDAMNSFEVAANNPNYSSFDGVLFNKNQTTLIQYPATKSGNTYIIPSSVSGIGNLAFMFCSALTQIQIPSGVTKIGFGPFVACSSLAAITVDPGNPNYCGSNGILFDKDQTKLIQYPAGNSGTDYSIPASVKSIGSGAFYECKRLTSMMIPSGVTSIEMHTFDECSGLISVTIPNSVTTIGDSAFADCTGLIRITIPDSVTYIDDDAFADCSSLTSVIIGNSVTSIGKYSFGSCSALTSITIPSSVTYIGPWAFSYCGKLKSITIPSGVAGIEENAPWGSESTITEIIRVDPPVISAQPSDTIVTPGGSTNFSVTATGTNLSYQWKKNGVNILNATGATLSLSNAQASDAASYTVVVSNAVGGVTSNPAVLAMAISPPITLSGTLMVSYWEGTGTYEYHYFKSPNQLFFLDYEESGDHSYTYNSTTGQLKDLGFQEDFILSFVSASKGKFTFSDSEVTNDGGSFFFYDSTWDLDFDGVPDGLQIERGKLPNLIHPLDLSSDVDGDGLSLAREGELGTNPNQADIAPSITAQPVTATANQGGSATFSVTATGTNLSYQWKNNGADLAGQTSAQLLLNNLQGTQAGSYTVVVSNAIGSETSTAAQLAVVIPPGITAQPAAATANQGASASFSVTATGTNLSYQWKMNGADLAGETVAQLLLNNLQGNQAGSYTVAVSNSAGSVTSNAAVLTVLGITSDLDRLTLNVGAAMSYPVTANPAPTTYAAKSLPAGLKINAKTGVIFGKPTKAGEYTVTLQALRKGAATLSAVKTFRVLQAPTFKLPAKVKVTRNKAFRSAPKVSAFPSASFSVVSGTLPEGIALNPTTGQISGITGTVKGNYAVTIRGSNEAGTTDKNTVLVVK